MNQKKLAAWLEWILAGIAVCGIILYAAVIPAYGTSLRNMLPECAGCFWPWLIFLWMTGIPCFAVVALAWKIATNIGRDRSFTHENARLFQWISWLAAGDAGCFFLGNILLLMIDMSHPAVVIASLLVVFVGVAVAVIAAGLSHLVAKAADLQEQSDWTI